MYDQMKRQSLARAASSKTTPTPSAQTLHSPISGEGYSYLSERARKNSRAQTYNQDEMINRLITLPISRNSNDLLGEGKFGRVYKHADGWVAKVRSNNIGPGEASTFATLAKNEIAMFNLFYGEGSAFGNEALYKIKESISGMEDISNFEQAAVFLKRIPGISLKQFIIENPTKKDIITEHNINDLLKRLKEKQIIHGDLNPGNIMINPDSGHLDLIDFATAEQKKHGFEKDEDELRETIASILENNSMELAEPEIRPGRRNYADLLRMQQNDTFDDFDDFDADNISANYSDTDRNVGSGDTHQSNIKLPWYQKLALRYMPISWFKTRAIKKLTGYPIRPKILHNGRYRSTASFNIEKCSTDDALAISSAFKLLAENNIKWIKTMGESIPDEILKNNRLAVEMNSRLTETIGLGDDDKLYYKLTRKGAPAGEDVYALSQQSISESGEFHVDIISVNPKTFFSRMGEGDAYNSGVQSGYIDGNFSVRGLGQSIAILSTILAARKVKNGLKRVSTNALNPFSANMFNKIVKK